MNYEVSHVYMDGTIGEEQLKGIDIFNSIVCEGDTSSLMIDDYSLKHGGKKVMNREGIISFYNNKMNIDNIKMESEFIYIAEMFPIFIKTQKERFRKDKKYVTFLMLDNEKIKLKDEFDNGYVKYSCPALSAAFHLDRSGVFDNNSISKQKHHICSILPKEYEEIERQVEKILKVFHCKNEYIFY